ncbi:MAG: peptidoglycan-binding protein [Clostridiales bacterium]|jgi:peptidoglycan hydrolase-like protein with peptidoglycan-binding domain|nr:peptidoglycan-binding protein [Clostridiales bacterium]
MRLGYLTVVMRLANESLPAAEARVLIKDQFGAILYDLVADANGRTEQAALEIPDGIVSGLHSHRIGRFTAEVPPSPYFCSMTITGVEVYSEVASVLPIDLTPIFKDEPDKNHITVHIEQLHGCDWRPPQNADAIPIEMENALSRLADVQIPESVFVHLGRLQEADALNVRVGLESYLKNVAASEIYADWSEEALYANIYCHVSLLLSRVFSRWYRSRGYPFDITSDPASDQIYQPCRSIPDNISYIVDRVFNVYIRRLGMVEPCFPVLCGGDPDYCGSGLSQWGSEYLGRAGHSPLDILMLYLSSDIEFAESTNFRLEIGNILKRLLKEGDSGRDVSLVQTYLNRLRINYPAIPEIENPNGFFDSKTLKSVKAFQSLFNLDADGIVGKTTWFQLTKIYSAAKRLEELENAKIKPNLDFSSQFEAPEENSENSALLRHMLDYASLFFKSVPSSEEAAYYGMPAQYQTASFQKTFGLPQTGKADAATLRMLYDQYRVLREIASLDAASENAADELSEPPGEILSLGSTGERVLLLQQYLEGLSKRHPSILVVYHNGTFGADTDRAVKVFQNLYGLTPNGIVDQKTWDRIESEYSSTPPQTILPFPGYRLITGSSGENVHVIQNYLNDIGKTFTTLPTISPDGLYGNNTYSAVFEFQKLFGLPATGFIDKDTWDSIVSVHSTTLAMPKYPGKPIQIGDEGRSALVAQTRMLGMQKAHPSIPAFELNGVFGEAFENAVKEFQVLFHLNPDGVIDEKTWSMLESAHKGLKNSVKFPGDNIVIGSTGDAVKAAQERLANLSRRYPSIPLVTMDGTFGNVTLNAVTEFQRIFGLPATGVIDRATWDRLLEEDDALKSAAEEILPVFARHTADKAPAFSQSHAAGNSSQTLKNMGQRSFMSPAATLSNQNDRPLEGEVIDLENPKPKSGNLLFALAVILILRRFANA